MRGSLRGILSRVERMGTEVRQHGCGGDHTRTKISFVDGDQAPPPWPEAGAPQECACGEPLEYLHHVVSWAS